MNWLLSISKIVIVGEEDQDDDEDGDKNNHGFDEENK
jgi:hypothetical protein